MFYQSLETFTLIQKEKSKVTHQNKKKSVRTLTEKEPSYGIRRISDAKPTS